MLTGTSRTWTAVSIVSHMMKKPEARMGDLATVFKTLGDENRLAIFQLIRERCANRAIPADQIENSVSKLADEFDLALSTVSHHLKELRTAGLIHCEKRGKSVYCSPNDDVLREIEQFTGGAT